MLADPAPLADTLPSASRFAPMLSGGAPTIGAANKRSVRPKGNSQTLGESQKHVVANNLQTNIPWKPTRVGVRADDIGAQRLEEDCIPRDGGLEGE